MTAGAAFFIPDVEVRARALKRRKQFHTVLAVYLRWVSLQMAGRVSAEAALPQAAAVGGGWPLAVIRDTLYHGTAQPATTSGSSWRARQSPRRRTARDLAH